MHSDPFHITGSNQHTTTLAFTFYLYLIQAHDIFLIDAVNAFYDLPIILYKLKSSKHS